MSPPPSDDFFDDFDANIVADDIASFLSDVDLTEEVTWRHQTQTDPNGFNPFEGEITQPSTTTTIRVTFGNLENRQADAHHRVGSYRFLALAADFTGDTPDAADVVERANGDVLIVTSARLDGVTGTMYLVEATFTRS